jgi:large subunit ribosomal protein L25
MEKTLSAKLREEIKKNKVKKIRNEGLIPAIIYGLNQNDILVTVKANEYEKLIHPSHTKFGRNTLIELEIDRNGKVEKEKVVTYQVQRNPLTGAYEHIDFIRVNDTTPVKLSLPLKFVGIAPGTKRGGYLDIKIKEVRVQILPTNIPSEIQVDLSSLDVDQSISVRDVKSDTYKILSQEGAVIVHVPALRSKGGAAENAAEAAATAKKA